MASFFVRWEWWTFVSGFWNIEVNTNVCQTLLDGGEVAAELALEIIEALDIIPGIGAIVRTAFIAELTATLALLDNGNGAYVDFELLIITKCYSSTYDWSKF